MMSGKEQIVGDKKYSNMDNNSNNFFKCLIAK